MPRGSRVKSDSGIYHVMIRGVNKQTIFENEKDKQKFLNLIYKLKKDMNSFELYGLCLMENHVHLLYKEYEGKSISEILKRLEMLYVQYFNTKYERIGPLFQGRFKSIPVETDEYLAGVLRYIHQNPVKSGMCQNPKDYFYSSYSAYFPQPGDRPPVGLIINTEPVISIFGRDWLMEYTNLPNNDEFMDIDNTHPANIFTDEDAKEFIKSAARIKSPKEINHFDLDKRNRAIKYFIKNGVSERQLSRLTGISRNIIRKHPGDSPPVR